MLLTIGSGDLFYRHEVYRQKKVGEDVNIRCQHNREEANHGHMSTEVSCINSLGETVLNFITVGEY